MTAGWIVNFTQDVRVTYVQQSVYFREILHQEGSQSLASVFMLSLYLFVHNLEGVETAESPIEYL